MTTPREAEQRRDAIEAMLAKPLERVFADFERSVEELAAAAYDDESGALLAGIRSPFTLGAVLSEWNSAVDTATGIAARVLPKNLATPQWLGEFRSRLLGSDFPASLFDSTKGVLLDAARQGWTKATTMSRLQDVLREQAPKAASGVVRTEATRLYNYATLGEMAQRGHALKQWVAVMDDRTRATHAEAHGQQVPINAHFDVGGWAMLYPGDASAPPEEIYNCRCVVVDVAGDEPAEALYEVPE